MTPATVAAGIRVEDLLDAAARRFPSARAVSDAIGSDTYAQLARTSRSAAGWLSANGVRPGDRVVLRLPGGRPFAALLYGAFRLGAIAVPVNPATGPLHLSWILRDAEPALVVSGPKDVAQVRSITAAPVHDVTAFATHREVALDDRSFRQHRPADAIALLMYTSGSTAMPRAVVCPHERISFAVAAIAARLRYTVDDVVLCCPPVSFDYGLYQLFLCADACAHLVLRPDLTAAAILRQARTVRATVLPIVPPLARILTQLADGDPGATTVRLLTNTGAALTTAQAADLRRVLPGTSVVPMYGMTECKRITIAEPDEDQDHPGTVGRPLAGTEVLVVDEAGNPQPPGVPGEIWVRGPHVMAGYWRAADATRERFDHPERADRTLRTGDLGYLDDDGRLYFVGRRDEIFKRKSVRMSVPELEAAARDVPGVAAAAAVAPGDDGRLVVWVTGGVEPADVLAGIARRLEPAKVPDRCVVLSAIPTTVNGKVDKAALRQLLGEACSA